MTGDNTSGNGAAKKTIDKIAKLRLRTLERGASPAEFEQAKTKIGELVIQYNLHISADQPQARTEPKARAAASEWIMVEHCSLVRKTDKALWLLIEGEQVWVPKSVVDFTKSYLAGGSVCVKSWFYYRELAYIFAGVA